MKPDFNITLTGLDKSLIYQLVPLVALNFGTNVAVAISQVPFWCSTIIGVVCYLFLNDAVQYRWLRGLKLRDQQDTMTWFTIHAVVLNLYDIK